MTDDSPKSTSSRAERIRHGLHGFRDAPNFIPYHHTLLYSEHFFGVTILTAPLQCLFRNPVLVYNVAFLAAFVISGCGPIHELRILERA